MYLLSQAFDYINLGYSLIITLLLIIFSIYGHLIKFVTKFMKTLPNLVA